jgi:hypothetical protein
MAGSEPGDPSSDDEPLPEDGVRRQVRTSKHEDLGVEVKRDLTAQGRLARGSSTNMSRLSFRVGAVPREERDPELEALREPVRAPAKPVVEARAPEPPVASEAPAATPEPPTGLARLFGKLFGRGGST